MKMPAEKKIFDRSSMLRMTGMSFAFILVILLSFGAHFFFRTINDETFWGDLAISFALCVYSLYFGISEGKDYYLKRDNGRYQKAFSDFVNIRQEVSPQDNKFNQWLEVYYEKQKKDYFISILSLHGNINPQVLDLDKNELYLLSKPYKKSWKGTEFEGRKDTYFRSLNEEQIELIGDIFAGKIKVEKIPDDFFKTIHGEVLSNEYVEQPRKTKKNSRNYVMLISSRLLMLFAYSFVFAIFGIKIIKSETTEEIIENIISTVSRLWTMLSSYSYGFMIGKTIVLNTASTIEYKWRVNNEFIHDTDFVALDEEELAKKEYEESIKEGLEVELVEEKVLKLGEIKV